MFEHRSAPLLPFARFALRQARFLLVATVMVLLSLVLGVAGYMELGGLGWVDALYNASMILGGMGPVDALHTDAAKLFASFYALYCGVALLGTVAVVLAPMLHRILHALHLQEDEDMA